MKERRSKGRVDQPLLAPTGGGHVVVFQQRRAAHRGSHAHADPPRSATSTCAWAHASVAAPTANWT